MTSLQDYFRSTGTSANELARRLDVAASTITRIVRGERKASPELAKRIEELTGIPRSVFRPDLYEGFVPAAQPEAAE